MSQARIDDYLKSIRDHNDMIEKIDAEIKVKVDSRNHVKGIVADRLGRIAFLEGKKRGRNPCHPPFNRNWNEGYDGERADMVGACHEG